MSSPHGAFVLAVFALLLFPPAPAEAACKSWDLSNHSLWGLKQNNGFILGLRSQQHGNRLSGVGYYYPAGSSNQRTEGRINGSINGSSFNFTMTWGTRSKGIYTGFIANDGTINGNTRDAANRNVRATCMP